MALFGGVLVVVCFVRGLDDYLATCRREALPTHVSRLVGWHDCFWRRGGSVLRPRVLCQEMEGREMSLPNQITAHNAGWRSQFRFAGRVLLSGMCEFMCWMR